MRLRELVSALEGGAMPRAEELDREVSGIAHDSRKAGAGSLFVAVRGFHSDGHRFVAQAVRQGAVAVVAEEGSVVDAGAAVPVIRVPDTRRALALLAAEFYGHPSRTLALIGITGTNGKTTTTYLVRSVLDAAGATTGLIGTIDYRVGGRTIPAPNTTPESLELQQLLAEMVRSGATHCVMEVSSHALALHRTDGCVFAAAAFTNLTQDHLDFHGDMGSYFRAKLLLFSSLSPDAVAVVNADDGRAAEIVRTTRARVITYGLQAGADIRPAGGIRQGIRGLVFEVMTPAGRILIESPLAGRHNISNILAAVGIGVALGLPPEAIGRGIREMRAVPGRMETVEEGQAFGVVVDYAHTEDALERLLDAVREVASGRVITVFGCGGDRDRGKRPKMGAAAVTGSDIVVVTSDNPRTEDPLAIICEVEAGMRGGGVPVERNGGPAPSPEGKKPYLVVPDRREAIEAAIGIAREGDVVVLAGKGHEDYQIIGERKLPFDDRKVAREAIRKRKKTDDR